MRKKKTKIVSFLDVWAKMEAKGKVDAFGGAEYRRAMVEVLVTRGLTQAGRPSVSAR